MRMDWKWCAGLILSVTLSLSALGSVSVRISTNTPFSFKAKCPNGPLKLIENKRTYYDLNLSCLTTGIKARDAHMFEDLGNAKTARFHMLNDFTDWFDGDLTLNGVNKGVAGKVANQIYTFKIKLSDYNIPNRSHLGLKIQDEIEITVEP